MKFVIVTLEWLLEHGLSAPVHARKSVDGNKVILHYDFISPVLNDEEIISYSYDSKDLKTILESTEWTDIDNLN